METTSHPAPQDLVFLSMVLDSVPDAVFVLNQAGRIIYLNQAACSGSGLARGDLLGKRIDAVEAPEYKQLAGDWMPELLRVGKSRVDTMRLTRGGISVELEVSAHVAEFEGEKIVVGTLRDITERQRAETRLRESEERYRSLVENIDLGITLIDRDHRIVMTNSAHGRLFRKPASEFSGRACFREFEKRDQVCAHCPGTKAMDSGQPAVARTEGVRDDGARFTAEIRAFPIRTADDVISGFIEVVEDVSERKRADEAIAEYAKKLESSNRMKDLFTDIMHHDILNPLQAAVCANDLLRENFERPEAGELAQMIDNNLTKAIDLIETTSRLARLDGLEHLDQEPLDLQVVIAGVICDLAPLVQRAGMVVENNLRHRMPVRANTIIADVFANLLANAIKHASAGKRVVVGGEDGGAVWRIEFKDFGRGIEDADKLRVFQRFHRSEYAAPNGNGLGLAIASRILELHQGGIGIKDNPEGGTIFVIEVPKQVR